MSPHRSTSLRSGFTTGTAAAAATQAAVRFLLGEERPERVTVRLPDGDTLEIPVHDGGIEDAAAWATVIQAGPSVTKAASWPLATNSTRPRKGPCRSVTVYRQRP